MLNKDNPCTLITSFSNSVFLIMVSRFLEVKVSKTLWIFIVLKEARQEVRQHWFIDSYISAYIQVLYRVTGVHPTGLTVDQGCRQVSTVESLAYLGLLDLSLTPWLLLVSLISLLLFDFSLTRFFLLAPWFILDLLTSPCVKEEIKLCMSPWISSPLAKIPLRYK